MPVRVLEDLPAELALHILQSGSCAVDTETSGLDWRTDRLEICQIFSPDCGPVIIRNTGRTPENLAMIIESPTVQKVLHFAPFDLRFLEFWWRIRAQSVRCTKTASRVLEPERPSAEYSLKPLLERRLGIRVGKGAVRTSDWGADELSAEQVEYAIDDVLHLLALHDDLTSSMSSEQRDLYEGICAYLPSDAHRELIGVPNPLVH
ncbi:hypothetical protein [Brachybacterium sp. GU-2]|uniref:hypothetical protein n=1 Tax=Brachybacterium sp. GU-2 TaxID=3069708 RepID=UPI00280AF406|nr:hypothetical protein [Brachybacterium sp. GU-2]WME22616.1 hypothetical protein RBL05_13935 [Brachybacterium sp. GU-2]